MDSHESFRELMVRVRAGNADAIQELFDRYAHPLLRVIRRKLHQPLRTRFDSQDFIQEVWQSFFATEVLRREFETPDELQAFLSEIARNKVASEYRHAGAQKRSIERNQSLDDSQVVNEGKLAARTATPSQVVMAEEQWEQLIHSQPPQYQNMLALLRQGHTHEDIARMLGVSTKAIQRLLRRIDPRLA
jgi:RNA polymerase sigma factor (sigma-70 family)